VEVALTAFDDSFRPRLAAGVVVSLLVHVVLGVVILAGPLGFLGPQAPLTVAASPAEVAEPPIRPGITESSAVSINWLGFAEPTKHQATPAETEQAALSPMAVGLPEAAEPIPEAAKPTTEAAETLPEAAEPMSEASEPLSAAEAPTEAPPSEPAEASPPVLALRTDAPAKRAPSLLQAVTRATARAAVRARAVALEAAEVAEQAVAAAAAAAAPPPGDPREAIASDKESDATSITKIAQWHPGRPPAVEGLDITTVRPRWTITTRLGAVPRNPVIELTFHKNGTVARARFLPGQDTGYRDVDGPLLDAIYRWTATGKALDALAADDPEAVVSLTMRIVLIPERGTIHRSPPSR